MEELGVGNLKKMSIKLLKAFSFMKLEIDEKIVSYGDYWYHYKENPKDFLVYEFYFDLEDIAIVDIIEKYSKRKINDSEIGSVIVAKDEKNRSLGLLWYINNYLEEKYKNNDISYNWKYVINNITEVLLINTFIKISGKATLYDNGCRNPAIGSVE
jgi:hypothetical protein